MYKLVVVAGKLRGQEYILENGENTLGRDSSCSIHFPAQGVSKKHFSITVSGDTCYIADLGSSNGTFVNGKAIALDTKYELRKREKLTIETSNVSNSHLETDFWAPIFSIVVK